MNRLVSSRAFSSARLLKLTEEFPFNANLTPAKAVAAVTKESKLNSGIRIISRDNNAPVANIKFAILGGSRSEKSDEKGFAHFIAASALSGNKLNSGIRTVRYFETLGADFKSHADREKIVYEVSVLSDRVDEAFTGLAGCVASPPYARHVYEEDVKQIAREQYHKNHENPRARLVELIHDAAYGEASPLGGSLYAISADHIDSDAVADYRNRHFVADNIVVTATGISHDKLKNLVESHLEGGKVSEIAHPLAPIALRPDQIHLAATPSTPFATFSPYIGGFAKERCEIDGETHVALAFSAPAGAAVKPYLALKSHLASKFGCENFSINNYQGGGLITFYTEGASNKVGSKVEAVIAELKAVASGNVDMKSAKNSYSLWYFSALEGDNSTCKLLNAHLNGTDAASFGDLRNVSQDEIVNAAKAVLKSSPSVAVLGSTAQAPTHTTVTQWWK